MIARGTCEFCAQLVADNQLGAFRVRGWELERVGGGANMIAGKERQPNRIAHARCVKRALDRERRGRVGQTSMLDAG